MKRRSFLSLLAAAFASPLIGQLDDLSIPSTGWQPVGVTVSFDWESIEALPASWDPDVLVCAELLADVIDDRSAEYAYRSFSQ